MLTIFFNELHKTIGVSRDINMGKL